MKPKVVIALSIYKPNLKWLEELLISLNNQTYQNIELLVWNDCPEDKYNYDNFFSKYIKNFRFYIKNGEKNLGVNGAFEELTCWAKGDYIAYCDQDDIWMPEKIEKMVNMASELNADLICCELMLINESSNPLNKKITLDNKILNDKLFEYAIMHCLVNACAMLVNLKLAKKSLPFPNIEKEYHDWWIGIYVSLYGKVVFVNEVLMKYRIYSNNTSGFYGLADIYTKEDYCKKRILVFKKKINYVCYRFRDNINITNRIDEINSYSKLRYLWFSKPSIKVFINLIKLSYINRRAVFLDFVFKFLPNSLFNVLINKIKKGSC